MASQHMNNEKNDNDMRCSDEKSENESEKHK
jgi:hypothetical protein